MNIDPKNKKVLIGGAILLILLVVVVFFMTKKTAPDDRAAKATQAAQVVKQTSDDLTDKVTQSKNQIIKTIVKNPGDKQVAIDKTVTETKKLVNEAIVNNNATAKTIDNNLAPVVNNTTRKTVSDLLTNQNDATVAKIVKAGNDTVNAITNAPTKDDSANAVNNSFNSLTGQLHQDGKNTAVAVKTVVNTSIDQTPVYTKYSNVDYSSCGDLINQNGTGTLDKCKAACNSDPDCLGVEEWGMGTSWYNCGLKGNKNTSSGPLCKTSINNSTNLWWKGTSTPDNYSGN